MWTTAAPELNQSWTDAEPETPWSQQAEPTLHQSCMPHATEPQLNQHPPYHTNSCTKFDPEQLRPPPAESQLNHSSTNAQLQKIRLQPAKPKMIHNWSIGHQAMPIWTKAESTLNQSRSREPMTTTSCTNAEPKLNQIRPHTTAPKLNPSWTRSHRTIK